MTINPQFQGHDQFDVLQGSITNHFARIESVLLQNECINGQYNLITSAAYAANCPVSTPGFTKVCISTNGSIVADLENSYIEADLQYTLNFKCNQIKELLNQVIPTAADADSSLKAGKYFIGFKQSLDALERYDIYVNSTLIYSQPFVGPESFIQLAGLNDTVRKNNPYIYTAYENAASMDQAVCGVYVDLSKITDLETKSIQVRIPVKINLHQFLLLSPIHYLPSFCGRWEIQLYFGSKNLVICPVDPHVYIPCTPYSNDFLAKKTADGTKWKGFPDYFTQINCPFYVWSSTWTAATTTGDPAKWTHKWDTITLQCQTAVLQECRVNMTQFQLRYEVYQALMAHYIETPMIIPTNTLSYQRFAHNSEADHIHAVANLPVENVDSLFVLLPETDSQQTCFYQPYLQNVRMSLGEFGIRPQQYMATYNASDRAFENRRFLTYLLDALNLENSHISAMNKDFINSIMPHVAEYSYGANGGDVEPKATETFKNLLRKQYDTSHFMIGFPLSQVGFQSGTVSSPSSNINFTFDANKVVPPELSERIKQQVPIIAMFLIDCELMIQVVPNSDQPVVKLSSKSIV